MINLEQELKKLNSEQYKAVTSLDGPILVVAGPGSGKTRVISYRIANILDKTDALASNILCLTFTESGVKSMKDKLKDVIGKDSYHVSIHTFHSFCNEIIQSFPEKFSFRSELKNLDDINRIKIIKEVLDKLPKEEKFLIRPLYDSYANSKAIIDAIQNLKREGIDYKDFEIESLENYNEVIANPELNNKTNKPTTKYNEKLKNVTKNKELSICYRAYQERINELGFYDYEDMILFVIDKLSHDDEVLAYYQEKYLYILVDEFQDSNGSQIKLLNLLGSYDKSPNIFAVGDDDQAIYRFQGANVSNMLDFKNQYENVLVLPLNKNYRSSQIILDAAQSVISNNSSRLTNQIKDLNKNLISETKILDQKLEVYEFNDNNFENKFIVDKIKALRESGEDLNDIAIFYRNHSDSLDLIELLLKNNIAFKLASGNNLMDERLVNQIINIFKVINYVNDDRDLILFKVLFYDYLNFNKLDIFNLTTFARRTNKSLFSIISNIELLESAGVNDTQSLFNFSEKIVEWNSLSSNENIYALLEKVLEDINFYNYLIKVDKNIENMNSIASFITYIKNIYLEKKDITLNDFLNDIKLASDSNISISKRELDINQNGVNLMTAHKSKGLEFKHVFILKAISSSWEAKQSRSFFKFNIDALNNDKDIKVEEERRLFFVALTRAKEFVYITYSNKYFKLDGVTETVKSIFVDEIDKKLINNINTQEFQNEDLSYFSNILINSRHLNHEGDEEEYLKTLVSKFRLSASSLNTYIDCPLRFKYESLIKAPQVLNIYSANGSAVHYALEVLNKRFIKDENTLISIEEILNIYTQKLSQLLPYSDKFIETNREGRDYLKRYLENNITKFKNSAEVEYKFNSNEIILEIPNSDPIVLTGKIDKLEWINKELNQTKIIDYKFKDPISENQLKGLTKVKDSSIYNQLLFYKILSDCDKFFKPKFGNSKYNVLSYEVEFLKPSPNGSYKTISLNLTDSEVNEFKLKVIDIVNRIRNLDFYGSSEYPLCKQCNFCNEVIGN